MKVIIFKREKFFHAYKSEISADLLTKKLIPASHIHFSVLNHLLYNFSEIFPINCSTLKPSLKCNSNYILGTIISTLRSRWDAKFLPWISFHFLKSDSNLSFHCHFFLNFPPNFASKLPQRLPQKTMFLMNHRYRCDVIVQ